MRTISSQSSGMNFMEMVLLNFFHTILFPSQKLNPWLRYLHTYVTHDTSNQIKYIVLFKTLKQYSQKRKKSAINSSLESFKA